MTIIISFQAYSQFDTSRPYFIRHKISGLVMDVYGNNQVQGNTVWTYTLNYTDAQEFDLSRSGIQSGGSTYRINALGSNLSLTIKKERPKLSLGTTAVSDQGTLITADEMVAEPPDPNPIKILKGHKFTLEEFKQAETPPAAHTYQLGTFNQIWKFVPVEGEANTYYILKSKGNLDMCIQPEGIESRTGLSLAELRENDFQKWEVLPSTPGPTTNVRLNDFKFDPGIPVIHTDEVKGILRWSNNSNNEEAFVIDMKVDAKNFNETMKVLAPNKSKWDFKVKSRGSKNEYCFTVRAYNKWGFERGGSISDHQICGQPDIYTRPPNEIAGVSKVYIQNCHSERKDVRMWSYDLTTNNGSWKDQGLAKSLWSGTTCSTGPLHEIKDFTEGRRYYLVGIDCGNGSPANYNDGNCQTIITAPFTYKSNGTSIAHQISGN